MGTFLSGYTGSRAFWNFPFDKWPRVSRSTKQQYIYLFRGNKFCIMPYKAPPIRLDEIPKKENTKPELACKEKDILWEHLRWPNTDFARALADAIQHAHQPGLQTQTSRWYSHQFIWSMAALSLLDFFVIERSVLMVLVFITKVC